MNTRIKRTKIGSNSIYLQNIIGRKRLRFNKIEMVIKLLKILILLVKPILF